MATAAELERELDERMTDGSIEPAYRYSLANDVRAQIEHLHQVMTLGDDVAVSTAELREARTELERLRGLLRRLEREPDLGSTAE